MGPVSRGRLILGRTVVALAGGGPGPVSVAVAGGLMAGASEAGMEQSPVRPASAGGRLGTPSRSRGTAVAAGGSAVSPADMRTVQRPSKPQMESVRQMLGGCAECLPAEALTKAGQPKKELSKSVLQRVLVTKMEQAGFAAELAQKRQDRHAGRRLQEWSPPGQQRAASPEASSTGEQVDASRRPFQRSARRGLAKTTARTAAADFQKCGFDQAQANVSVFSGDFFNNVQRSDAGAVKKFEAGVAFAQQRIGEKLSSTDTPPPSVAPAPRSVLAAGGMSPPPASPPTAGGISLRPTSPTRTYRGALVLKSWRRSGSIASTSASTPPKSTVLVLVP